jgi:hypothetical protein
MQAAEGGREAAGQTHQQKVPFGIVSASMTAPSHDCQYSVIQKRVEPQRVAYPREDCPFSVWANIEERVCSLRGYGQRTATVPERRPVHFKHLIAPRPPESFPHLAEFESRPTPLYAVFRPRSIISDPRLYSRCSVVMWENSWVSKLADNALRNP